MTGITFETRFNIVKLSLFVAALLVLSVLLEYTHLTCREFLKSPSLCNLFQTVNEVMPIVLWVAFFAVVLALAFNSVAELKNSLPSKRRERRKEMKRLRFE